MICDFKFKKFPELLEPYKIYFGYEMKLQKISMKNSASSGKGFDEVRAERDKYARLHLGRLIFDAFSKKKPKLYNQYEERKESWEDVFGDDYDSLDDEQIYCLVTLLDRGYIYSLPDKYYD
jgi:hypothetical protein